MTNGVLSTQRPSPGEGYRALISGERYAVASAFCRACVPSANSSIIFLLNAGMSSGLRLVTRPLSVTTSWSTQLAPALRRSFCSDGHDVILQIGRAHV